MTRLVRWKLGIQWRADNVRLILRNHPTDTAELFQAFQLFAVGFWLLLPFASFQDMPAFRGISHFGSEAQVGAFIIGMAWWSVWCTASAFDRYRFWAAAIRAAIFTFLASCIFYGDFRLLSGPLFTVMAANAFWSLWRLGKV